jgi:DNA-binding NarL/FixJ family response regulator
MTTAPRYLLASLAEATTVLRRLDREGWTTREGFALTDSSWDVSAAKLVLFGRVPDLETVQLAVHSAARGAGIVAACDPASELGRALLGDLRRLGPVRSDPVRSDLDDGPDTGPGGPGPLHHLIPEQRALLERLANGETIAAAAAAEYLSLRTANRRIAQARELLGVRTTREAVLAYLRQRGPS